MTIKIHLIDVSLRVKSLWFIRLLLTKRLSSSLSDEECSVWVDFSMILTCVAPCTFLSQALAY